MTRRLGQSDCSKSIAGERVLDERVDLRVQRRRVELRFTACCH